jgi:hypothetical protein
LYERLEIKLHYDRPYDSGEKQHGPVHLSSIDVEISANGDHQRGPTLVNPDDIATWISSLIAASE